MVTDPKLAETLIKSPREIGSTAGIELALGNILGDPRHMIHYTNDNSGSGVKPRPGSNIKPQNRIFHHHHHAAHRFLQGKALEKMTSRYASSLTAQFDTADITEEWVDYPDFYQFIRDKAFRGTVEALFGTSIFELTPDLSELFWDFDNNVTTLIAGLPRWMTPHASSSRDKMLKAIKKWHCFASEHSDFKKTDASDPEWDRY